MTLKAFEPAASRSSATTYSGKALASGWADMPSPPTSLISTHNARVPLLRACTAGNAINESEGAPAAVEDIDGIPFAHGRDSILPHADCKPNTKQGGNDCGPTRGSKRPRRAWRPRRPRGTGTAPAPIHTGALLLFISLAACFRLFLRGSPRVWRDWWRLKSPLLIAALAQATAVRALRSTARDTHPLTHRRANTQAQKGGHSHVPGRSPMAMARNLVPARPQLPAAAHGGGLQGVKGAGQPPGAGDEGTGAAPTGASLAGKAARSSRMGTDAPTWAGGAPMAPSREQLARLRKN